MTADHRRLTGSTHEPLKIVDSLLVALGESFDLSTAAPAGTLGEAVRRRLQNLDTETPPSWGTEGLISQVAKQETENLDFYYRPHLVPEMSQELRLAHYLQFDLLPRELPTGCPFEIAAVLESYCHLSGDLIGWNLEHDDFFLWIADVAGHGVRAGLAAAVMHFLMSGVDRVQDLGEMARSLNDNMFAARNPSDRRALYITAFMMRVSPEGRFHYASAGHPPMMLRRADGSISRLMAQGPPIGLIPEQSFRQDQHELEHGDTLFLYTDGLVEARSPKEEEFGFERIEHLVRSATDKPLDLSRAAYREVQAHKDTLLLDDDLTFLAARFS